MTGASSAPDACPSGWMQQTPVGSGAEVRGSVRALLLLLTGRPTAPYLSGPGAALLDTTAPSQRERRP